MVCAREESQSSRKGQQSGNSNPDTIQRDALWYDEAWSTAVAALGGGWLGNLPPRPRLSR